MIRHLSLLLMLAAAPAFAATSDGATPPHATATIEDFYKQYLNAGNSQPKHKHPPYSAGVAALVQRDLKTCAKVQNDICGWGEDGDVWIDAQDSDPKLTFASSGFTARETAPGEVEAKFNVFPGTPDGVRTVRFKLKLEKGSWGVDDVIDSTGGSARKQMEDEIKAATHAK